jgi:hypothetical protein
MERGAALQGHSTKRSLQLLKPGVLRADISIACCVKAIKLSLCGCARHHVCDGHAL